MSFNHVLTFMQFHVVIVPIVLWAIAWEFEIDFMVDT